jgi:2-C-methyl-D-erythritol 4-phosphate cytidylyltransferase
MKKTEETNKTTIAIIPAAGWGVRMGGNRPKQFLLMDDRPILAITLSCFQECPAIDGIILVTPEKEIEYCRREIVEPYNLNKVIKIVKGGQKRQDSVRFGLGATEGNYQIVVIHDGVRPFINPDLIERTVFETRKHRAVVTAMPAKETIKELDKEGFVIKTHNRENIWLVQTPQAFYFKDIMAAHTQAEKESWEDITDDALLMERMGIRVKVIQGLEQNIKITTPYDLSLARHILKAQGAGRKAYGKDKTHEDTNRD